jgi:hypothetical protein
MSGHTQSLMAYKIFSPTPAATVNYFQDGVKASEWRKIGSLEPVSTSISAESVVLSISFVQQGCIVRGVFTAVHLMCVNRYLSTIT